MKMCNELATPAVPWCLYQHFLGRLCVVLMHISNLLCKYIDYYFTLILVRSRLTYIHRFLVLICVIPRHAEHSRLGTLLGHGDSLAGLPEQFP